MAKTDKQIEEEIMAGLEEEINAGLQQAEAAGFKSLIPTVSSPSPSYMSGKAPAVRYSKPQAPIVEESDDMPEGRQGDKPVGKVERPWWELTGPMSGSPSSLPFEKSQAYQLQQQALGGRSSAEVAKEMRDTITQALPATTTAVQEGFDIVQAALDGRSLNPYSDLPTKQLDALASPKTPQQMRAKRNILEKMSPTEQAKLERAYNSRSALGMAENFAEDVVDIGKALYEIPKTVVGSVGEALDVGAAVSDREWKPSFKPLLQIPDLGGVMVTGMVTGPMRAIAEPVDYATESPLQFALDVAPAKTAVKKQAGKVLESTKSLSLPTAAERIADLSERRIKELEEMYPSADKHFGDSSKGVKDPAEYFGGSLDGYKEPFDVDISIEPLQRLSSVPMARGLRGVAQSIIDPFIAAPHAKEAIKRATPSIDKSRLFSRVFDPSKSVPEGTLREKGAKISFQEFVSSMPLDKQPSGWRLPPEKRTQQQVRQIQNLTDDYVKVVGRKEQLDQVYSLLQESGLLYRDADEAFKLLADIDKYQQQVQKYQTKGDAEKYGEADFKLREAENKYRSVKNKPNAQYLEAVIDSKLSSRSDPELPDYGLTKQDYLEMDNLRAQAKVLDRALVKVPNDVERWGGLAGLYIPKTEFRAIEHFFMNADKVDDGISAFLRSVSSRFKGLKTAANPVFLVNQAFTNFGILPLVTNQRFLSTTPQTNAITEMGKTLAGVKPDALDMLAIKKGIDRSSSWTPDRDIDLIDFSGSGVHDIITPTFGTITPLPTKPSLVSGVLPDIVKRFRQLNEEAESISRISEKSVDKAAARFSGWMRGVSNAVTSLVDALGFERAMIAIDGASKSAIFRTTFFDEYVRLLQEETPNLTKDQAVALATKHIRDRGFATKGSDIELMKSPLADKAANKAIEEVARYHYSYDDTPLLVGKADVYGLLPFLRYAHSTFTKALPAILESGHGSAVTRAGLIKQRNEEDPTRSNASPPYLNRREVSLREGTLGMKEPSLSMRGLSFTPVVGDLIGGGADMMEPIYIDQLLEDETGDWAKSFLRSALGNKISGPIASAAKLGTAYTSWGDPVDITNELKNMLLPSTYSRLIDFATRPLADNKGNLYPAAVSALKAVGISIRDKERDIQQVTRLVDAKAKDLWSAYNREVGRANNIENPKERDRLVKEVRDRYQRDMAALAVIRAKLSAKESR